MSGPIQVYHFLLDARVGGPLVVLNTVRSRLEKDYPFVICSNGDGPLTQVRLPIWRTPFRAMFVLETLLTFFQVFALAVRARSRGPVIFHVHSGANSAPVLAAALARVPVVWHFHEAVADGIGLIHPLLVQAFRMIRRTAFAAHRSCPAFRIVCAAENAAEAYHHKDAVIINSPLDTAFWNRDAALADIESRGGAQAVQPAVTRTNDRGCELHLVHTGAMNILKGQDLLLDALHQLGRNIHVTFIGAELAGKAAYAAQLRAHPYTATGRVHFAGLLPSQDVRGVLIRFDAFVLPSRSEVSPVALLEALALEMPVLATLNGASGKSLEGGAGIGVPPGDVPALKAGILQLLAMSPEQRAEMGRRGREGVVRNFSLENIAARHHEVYDEIVRRMAPQWHRDPPGSGTVEAAARH